MRADEIRTHLRKEPFQPLRVFISEGSHYDVCHPELMFVTQREIIIGLEAGNGDIPERSVYIDPIHITRIEPVKQMKRKRTKKRTK